MTDSVSPPRADKPQPSSDFKSLGLPDHFVKNLSDLSIRQPSDIQQKTIPEALKGKDILAQAKTGSGKTLAFATPILLGLKPKLFKPQALILCPTRELADQVAVEMRKLARSIGNIKVLTLCGGMPFGPQIGSLAHGAHVVVGTPGRISAHLRKGSLELSNAHALVLDEADRMLDMGFIDEIQSISTHLPTQKQVLMFSATYPDDILSLSQSLQKDALEISAEVVQIKGTIEQSFLQVCNEDKFDALIHVLAHFDAETCMVFCNTIKEVKSVTQALVDADISALGLHGDLDQKERTKTLVRFTNKSIKVLVATDVAARGLHIDDLPLVVNFGLSRDDDVHVHRIGRTGRAGQTGRAYNLFSEKEQYKVSALQERFTDDNFVIDYFDDQWIAKHPYIDGVSPPEMVTVAIDGGKKNKVRAGDILGALTAKGGISGKEVGKIAIQDFDAYVAIERSSANRALKKLQTDGLKGRHFKVRKLTR